MILVMMALRMRPQAIGKAFDSLETKGISCILMRCYGKKRKIQKERWYQKERNKEIVVKKKESMSLSRILGEMKQEERGNGTIQARANSDFDVKCAAIQFYRNNHNSQSDCWTGLTLYMESPDMLSYLGLKFQVNRSSERHPNIGQQRLYEFCYLLPFDLWTSFLARILFLKGCGSLFWKYPKFYKDL